MDNYNKLDYSLLLRAYDKNTTVGATVGDVSGNGYKVKLLGFNAYLPFTQVAPNEKFEAGQEVEVCIIKIMPLTNKVIVSAVAAAACKNAGNLETGSVYNGKVTKIIKSGAFVSFGEFKGYIHNSELSYLSKKVNASDVLQVGQEIPVKVISIEKEEETNKILISLSYKQAIEDPWNSISVKVGEIIEGTVHNIRDFGLFLNYNEVNVFVHASELPLTPKSPKPRDFAQIGDTLKVKIVSADLENRKIAGSVNGVGER